MNEFGELTLHFMQNHAADAARVLQSLPADKVAEFINTLPARQTVNVIRKMPSHSVAAFLPALDSDKRSTLLRDIGVQGAARILRHLNREQCQKELDQLSGRHALRIKLILNFPQDSVGASMDPDVFIANAEQSVEDVIQLIKRGTQQHYTDIYVTDTQQHLSGVVSATQLIRANKKSAIGHLMDKNVATLSARAALSTVVSSMGWLTRNTLPVLDRDNRLIGSLSYNALFVTPKHAQDRNAGMGYLIGDLMSAYSIGWMSMLDVVFSTQRE